MKFYGLAFLFTLVMVMLFSCVSAQITDSTGSFKFTGTVTYQDLEGGFFGIITDTGDQLLPTNLPGQYEVDGLRISGTATPQVDMISAKMWGTLVSVDNVTPLNGGGVTEQAWYQTEDTENVIPDDKIFRILGRVAADLQMRLDIIDRQLSDVAADMSGKDYSKENQTILLSNLVESEGNRTGVYEASILDKSGRISAVYPDVYQPSIGTDLSRQPHIARVLSYPSPGMSTYLKTVEGKNAVIITYPVLSKQKAVSSYVSSLVDPSVLISPDKMDELKESGYSLMVEQPDGIILSESDSEQVGRSTWNDPDFNVSPSLLKTAVHLQNARSGYDTYSGLKNQEVQVAWTTVTLHGVPWRVVVMNP